MLELHLILLFILDVNFAQVVGRRGPRHEIIVLESLFDNFHNGGKIKDGDGRSPFRGQFHGDIGRQLHGRFLADAHGHGIFKHAPKGFLG